MGGDGLALVQGIAPPTQDCIESINIYRLDSGAQSGQGEAQLNSEWLRVATVSADTTEWEDNTGTWCNGMPLASWGAFPAPRGVDGLAVLSNGAVATFSDCTIHFSAPVDLAPWPHAFSGDSDIQLPSQVIDVVSAGDNLYVSTTGNPYIVTPRYAEGDLIYVWNEVPVAAPAKKGTRMISVGGGAAYISTLGLVQINAGGGGVVSDPYFKLSQWRDSNITKLAHVGGRIFALGETSWVFFTNNVGHSHTGELMPLSRISLLGQPFDVYNDNEYVYFLNDEGLWRFDPVDGGDDDCCPYTYVSKTNLERSNKNFAAAKVTSTGPVNFSLATIECGNTIERLNREVPPCTAVRIPPCHVATQYRYTVHGCSEVHSIHIAETKTDLSIS